MKISYTRVYGKACYEMSGERHKEYSVEFKDFVAEVLRIDRRDLGGENKIPMPLRYPLVQGVIDGSFGNNYGISYCDIKTDKENVTKKELLGMFKDIYIKYDKMNYLKDKTLEKFLDM